MDAQSPLISSFVIRFVMNEAQNDSVDGTLQPALSGNQDSAQHPPYRGSIRHIQSDEELNFHLWEDAVEFIRRYVPLDHGPEEFTGTEKGSDGT